MKKALISLNAILLACATSLATPARTPSPAASAVPAPSDAQYGGEITLWPKDPGTFLFVNAQQRLARDVLAKSVASLASEFSIDLRLVDGESPRVDAVPAALASLKAKGAIWIVDSPALPVALVASEDGWAFLNVAPLLADAPAPAALQKRVGKFVFRTFANANGIGDSPMMPACVMKQAIGVKGVDQLLCATYSPEACSKISSYLTLAGYKRCRRGTYYDACEEGWAPAPTNAVQKAIWDKVHELPSKPLTISRESEKKR